MSQPSSDSAFEIFGACAHSLRFALGAPVGYPDAPAPFTTENPPDALYRRVTVASPPPTRQGQPWWAGLLLKGEPYQPNGHDDRLAEVAHADGLASLDAAEPETVVLDRVVTLPRAPHVMNFPGDDLGRYLCSIFYWTGIPPNAAEADVKVQYYKRYRLEWDRPPADKWVAISLDAFYPPERDSGDIIVPIGACDQDCPEGAGAIPRPDAE